MGKLIGMQTDIDTTAGVVGGPVATGLAAVTNGAMIALSVITFMDFAMGFIGGLAGVSTGLLINRNLQEGWRPRDYALWYVSAGIWGGAVGGLVILIILRELDMLGVYGHVMAGLGGLIVTASVTIFWGYVEKVYRLVGDVIDAVGDRILDNIRRRK